MHLRKLEATYFYLLTVRRKKEKPGYIFNLDRTSRTHLARWVITSAGVETLEGVKVKAREKAFRLMEDVLRENTLLLYSSSEII